MLGWIIFGWFFCSHVGFLGAVIHDYVKNIPFTLNHLLGFYFLSLILGPFIFLAFLIMEYGDTYVFKGRE